ncbi:necrosis inducing protein-domain-containing protein [Aspergillus multicolor]|uniref:NPP1 family protein n=1 Tax=Aspergillus multicolor TaxID=41759 RepID=UPI003CCDDCC9
MVIYAVVRYYSVLQIRSTQDGLTMLISILRKLSPLALFLIFYNVEANLLTPFSTTASPGALKFQPIIDFDTDSCYQTAALSTDGRLNDGISVPIRPEPQPTSWLREQDVLAAVPTDAAGAGAAIASNSTDPSSETRASPNLRGCRNGDRLSHSQTYVRERCNHGWCAYLYGYYFEGDFGWLNSHTHDWEHIIVWTLNDNVFFVSWSAHSKYTTHHQSTVRFDGTHPKFVYHLGGWGTHSFRKAEEADERIENETGGWFKAPLVSLEKLSCDLNRKLLGHGWGSAQMDLRKDRFGKTLDDWMPWDARNNEKFNPWEPVVPGWAL